MRLPLLGHTFVVLCVSGGLMLLFEHPFLCFRNLSTLRGPLLKLCLAFVATPPIASTWTYFCVFVCVRLTYTFV